MRRRASASTGAALAVLMVASGACQKRDGVAIGNWTDARVVVIDLRLGPGQVAQLPPHTSTRYSFAACTGPLEIRTDDGRVVKRVERACEGGSDVIVSPEDLARSSP